jgi:hypothetical protein
MKRKDLRFKPVGGEQMLKLFDARAFVARRIRGIKPV